MHDYSGITGEKFQDHAMDVLHTYSTNQIMAIPGVASIILEELNNEILDHWRDSSDCVIDEYEVRFIDEEGDITFVESVEYAYDKSQDSVVVREKALEKLQAYAQVNLRYYDACRAEIVKTD